MDFITLDKDNLATEHICCAFSDKKCAEGYALKKEWLRGQFDKGYIFRRLNERAKVFIEYGPAEEAWAPVEAPGYLFINCFWVSGQYKGKGYAKALLQSALDDAAAQGKNGLATVVGTKKFHFLSDTKWLLGQGFVEAEKLQSGFSLLAKKINPQAPDPKFAESARMGKPASETGLVAYYSNRCPYTDLYVNKELSAAAQKRGWPLEIIKLSTIEDARSAPSPATIFSLFKDGKFVTTDISICLDSRFDKTVK